MKGTSHMNPEDQRRSDFPTSFWGVFFFSDRSNSNGQIKCHGKNLVLEIAAAQIHFTGRVRPVELTIIIEAERPYKRHPKRANTAGLCDLCKISPALVYTASGSRTYTRPG